MPVLLLLALLPLIEIAGFVIVGGWLGLWPTLALVILAAVLGVAVIRLQGPGAVRDVQGGMARAADPLSPLVHRALKVVAGGLLILPGFFSDLIAVALLVPPVRRLIIATMASRMTVRSAGFGADFGASGPMPRRDSDITVIDGEFFEVDPGDAPPRSGPGGGRVGGPGSGPAAGGSGWTRH